jgi:hydroxypyruvate reductase
MTGAAVRTLGARLQGGVVIAPQAVEVAPPLEGITAEHPQPGPGSEAAGRRALDVASSTPRDSEVLVLISGGASSLMCLPDPDISLDDKRAATGVLLRSGADIHALNTVRKHLSRIKGGRLAVASSARVRALVLSDVVGDDLSFIASGPTVADPSTYADALAVVDRFGGRDAYPRPVVAHLEAGAAGRRPESPKPGDPALARTETRVIGGRHEAMQGAAAEARLRGYAVIVVDDPIVGEARRAGVELVRSARARAASTSGRPICVVASGETTVQVRGHGRGGRNQELAIAAATALAGDRPAAMASAGTDGIDGPTDAAGALVDHTTLTRAAAAGLAPAEAVLDANDAYPWLDAIGDLIRLGPTGTNVGDLQVFLLA